MKIIADTNILVRAITGDDERQSLLAQKVLAEADIVALPSPALCELCWVLSRGYKIPADEIAQTLRRLLDSANVRANRRAAEAGLSMMEAGGDFADGVIAFEGAWLGGETFVSFDKTATRLLATQGAPVRLLA
jgi:predicted nucleic-acid-binding protein